MSGCVILLSEQIRNQLEVGSRSAASYRLPHSAKMQRADSPLTASVISRFACAFDPHAANERVQQKAGELMGCFCLHFAYYNFCRIHQTLRVTPAIESTLTDHVWDLAELLA